MNFIAIAAHFMGTQNFNKFSNDDVYAFLNSIKKNSI